MVSLSVPIRLFIVLICDDSLCLFVVISVLTKLEADLIIDLQLQGANSSLI